MINEQIDTAFIERAEGFIQSYKRLVVESMDKDREIAKLKKQYDEEKKKNDELKKEIRKAKDDLTELKDYMSSTIASLLATKDKKFLKKLEREIMQKIMDNCCEDSEMDIEIILDR